MTEENTKRLEIAASIVTIAGGIIWLFTRKNGMQVTTVTPGGTVTNGQPLYSANSNGVPYSGVPFNQNVPGSNPPAPGSFDAYGQVPILPSSPGASTLPATVGQSPYIDLNPTSPNAVGPIFSSNVPAINSLPKYFSAMNTIPKSAGGCGGGCSGGCSGSKSCPSVNTSNTDGSNTCLFATHYAQSNANRKCGVSETDTNYYGTPGVSDFQLTFPGTYQYYGVAPRGY